MDLKSWFDLFSKLNILEQTSLVRQQRYLPSCPKVLSTSQHGCGCVFSKEVPFSSFHKSVPAKTCSSFKNPWLTQTWLNIYFSSCVVWPDIILSSDPATLFTYFAPRCICTVYPWFYIFLQSKCPKMEKHMY